jgi:outer membrane lipoprotein SlyB
MLTQLTRMNSKFLLCLPVIVLFSSCAQDSMNGSTFSRDEARQAQSVNPGRITSIRNVKIEGGNTAGTVIGGLAGGALGSNIGSGRTSNTAGAIGGALVGGAVGSHAQQRMQSRNGIEITVRLDSGRSVAVVQEISANEQFSVGDRVRVLSSGSRDRVAF